MPTTSRDFHLNNIDQDDVWGTNIDKLDETKGTFNSSLTVMNFGTNTALGSIIINPFNSRSTRGTTNAPDYGWAINQEGTDGMDSTATAKRTIPAGVWDFGVRTHISVANTGVGNDQSNVTVRIYRVASDDTRTLLFSASTGNFTNVATAPLTDTRAFSSSSQPEYVFENDETILASWEYRTTGVSVTGRTVNLHVNASADSYRVRTPSPGIRTRHIKSINATMLGKTSIVKKIKKPILATMTAIPSLTRQLTLFRVFNATMTGKATIIKKIGIKQITTTMTGVATIIKKVKIVQISATMVGNATIIKKIKLSFNTTMTAVASVSRRLTLYRVFSATMTGIPSFNRKLTIRRTFTATMKGATSILAKLPIGKIPSGGGTTNIIKKLFIFDD